MENETVNKLELASELADREINNRQQNALLNNPSNLPYPNGIVKEDDNGDVKYTEEAQDDFNDLYSEFIDLIEKTKV